MSYNKDCLNIFRLLAAIGVMYGHIVCHLSIEIPTIINKICGYLPGVPLFFCLSGFLVWPSVGRSSSFGEFIRKRFWRIYPELWIAVLVGTVVILLLYDSSIEWGDFLLFNLAQATFLQFWTPDFLRGYGCGTPNGALWTITVIVQFYLISFWLYKLVYNKNKLWLILLIMSILFAFSHNYIVEMLPVIMGKIYGCTVIPYLWMFLMGAFLSEKKDYCLAFLKKYWFLFLVIAFLGRFFSIDFVVDHYYHFFITIFSFIGIIGFAYRFPMFNLKTDISYAVYVYHMVVVNAFIEFGFTQKLYYFFIIFVITFMLAYVSTITVGQWGLKRKEVKSLNNN